MTPFKIEEETHSPTVGYRPLLCGTLQHIPIFDLEKLNLINFIIL